VRSKLLVTGATGLLGHAVQVICPGASYVSSRDYDLRDRQQVEAMFEKYQPKHVLHLAACVGGVKHNAEHNADLFTNNLLINTHVLNCAREAKVDRLIGVISTCAFQIYDNQISTEKDLHVGLPFHGNLGYGYSKRTLDIQTQLLNEQYGCRFSTIAPVTLYGPYDNCDLENSHVLSALIHKCYLAKKNKTALQVWGSGKAVRQFVFAPDIARLLIAQIDKFDGPQTTVIAPDDGISIGELAKLVAKTMRFDGKIEFDTSKPEGILKRVVKSEKNPSWLRDFKFTSFEKGLKKTMDWFVSHEANTASGLKVAS